MITDKQGQEWLLRKLYDAGLIGKVLPSLNENEILDIAEHLGIVDWSKVAVDTPICVKDDYDEEWVKSYFASYKNGEVRAWMGGRTSFSVKNKTDTFGWKYAKLAEV